MGKGWIQYRRQITPPILRSLGILFLVPTSKVVSQPYSSQMCWSQATHPSR